MHDSDLVAEPLKFAGRVKCLLKVEKGTYVTIIMQYSLHDTLVLGIRTTPDGSVGVGCGGCDIVV